MVKCDRSNRVIEQLWQRQGRLGAGLGLLLTMICLGVNGGCKGYILDARDAIVDIFYHPDPMTVLKESTVGRERAKALYHLQEPLAHGGKQEEQDAVIEMLARIATSDHEPLCRLQAIRTLGRFKDERAVQILEQSYYQARTFPPDLSNLIRQQALSSLAQTKHPGGRQLLIDVARSGAKEDSLADRQRTIDLRLAAIRGLAEYGDLADVTETLLHILQSERDVALRDRAHESLVKATGKNLPPDAQAWDQFLHNSDQRAAQQRRGVLQLMGWQK